MVFEIKVPIEPAATGSDTLYYRFRYTVLQALILCGTELHDAVADTELLPGVATFKKLYSGVQLPPMGVKFF